MSAVSTFYGCSYCGSPDYVEYQHDYLTPPVLICSRCAAEWESAECCNECLSVLEACDCGRCIDCGDLPEECKCTCNDCGRQITVCECVSMEVTMVGGFP